MRDIAFIRGRIRAAAELDLKLFERACFCADIVLIREPTIFDCAKIGAWETAVIRLVQLVLPGWAWKIGTCSVSDDAWLVPDFNCPVHGERLCTEFGYPDQVAAGSIWDAGVDIDRRPPGNTALALLEAFLVAWERRNG